MKNFSLVLIAIASTISTVPAIGAEPPAAPTGLVSFVAKPTVVLDLAEEVGSLQSIDATVTVAAVVATATARPVEQMKGAHFSLENNVGADFVYLDETELDFLLGDLANIQGGISGLKAPSTAMAGARHG